METRSCSKVKGKTSPPRATTVGGTQPVRDVFVDPPSSAAGLSGNGRISPRSSSLEAGPRRTCHLTASSESASGTRGPAQEVKNDENRVIAASQSSETVLIPAPDEGWNPTFTSDFRSLFNFSVLSLTLESVIFIKNQNSVFTRASVNGVVVWSSTERRTH